MIQQAYNDAKRHVLQGLNSNLASFNNLYYSKSSVDFRGGLSFRNRPDSESWQNFHSIAAILL